jgi:hypothetical protein
MSESLRQTSLEKLLSAEDLLAGSNLIHDVAIPTRILLPGGQSSNDEINGKVRLKPLDVATLTLIAKASKDDPGLIPLLMIKEALVEPEIAFEKIHKLHIGLVYYLVTQINRISGLDADGDTIPQKAGSPLGETHLLLAEHFGWTPEQVQSLTPGQIAIYLAGINKMQELNEGKE